MSAIPISDLTQATVEGNGVFDVLMRANKAHLEAEFAKNRIKGPEYATVYLGALNQVMQTALAFVLAKEKTALEADLLQKQIDLVQKQIEKETVTITQINAQIALLNQQRLNAEVENTVLVARECKLRAEYDLILSNVQKSAQETALLTQKVATEKAQTQAVGVDDNSVVGKQKLLYQAQTNGFVRDAEQKAAKLMVDTWNVRRTTDEGTSANETNLLNDAAVGRAVNKLLTGVGA